MRVPWKHARGSVQQKGGNLRFAVRMWRLTGGDIWEAKRRMDEGRISAVPFPYLAWVLDLALGVLGPKTSTSSRGGWMKSRG